jgi:WD40 repeat protein
MSERTGTVGSSVEATNDNPAASGHQSASYVHDSFASYATDPDGELVREVEAVLEGFHRRPYLSPKYAREIELCVDGRDFKFPKRNRGRNDDIDLIERVVRVFQRGARSLIVFCGPQSREHPWIKKEIQWWMEDRPDDPIYFALTHGANPHKPEQYMPSPLLERGGADNVIFFDLRGFYLRRNVLDRSRGRRKQVRDDASNWKSVRKFDEEVAKIAATLVSDATGKDIAVAELLKAYADSDRRAKRLRMVKRVAAVALLVLAGGFFSWFLLRAEAQADSETLVRRSRVQTDEGWHDGALRLALIAARSGLFTPPALDAEAALARAAQSSTLIAELRGHVGPITKIAFNENGTQLATVSGTQFSTASASQLATRSKGDHSARLWDTRTGNELFVLNHDNSVNAIMFSPDWSQLATASDDRTWRLWNASNGTELLKQQDNDGPVKLLKFNRDGDRLVTAGNDGNAHVWDSTNGKHLLELKRHNKSVVAVSFSPDGKQLATASEDGLAWLWDANTGAALHPLCCHTDVLKSGEGLKSIAYDARGTRVATAGRNGVRLWEATTWRQIGQFEGHEQDGQPVEMYFDVKFSRDGNRLAAAGEYGSALLVDLRNPNSPVRSYLCCHARFKSDTWVNAPDIHWVSVVDISPGGELVATAGQDGTARLWATADGSNSPISVLRGQDGGLNDIAFSPDGRHLATASEDGTTRIWDVSGEVILTREPQNSTPADVISGIAISPDGKRIVVAGPGNVARILDASNGDHIASLPGHEGTVTSVVFDRKGFQIATTSEDKKVRIWNLNGADEPIILRHDSAVNAVAFSPDGNQIATADEQGQTHIWEISKKGADPYTIPGRDGGPTAIAFSHNGSLLRIASQKNSVLLRDVKSGKSIVLCCHKNEITSVSFSLDARRLATVDEDGQAHIWDTSSGVIIQSLPRGYVNFVVFSPNGSRLATGGDQGTVQIWDATTTAEIVSLRAPYDRGHWGKVTGIAFSPDMSRLVTAGEYGMVGIWPVRFAAQLHGQELIDAVCAERLVGHEIERKSVRRLIKADVDGVPTVLFPDDVGRDVCAVPTLWEQVKRSIFTSVRRLSSGKPSFVRE